ncbi:MAG: DUF1826 domain-containing protein [Candidatus Thiodiazotropha endolucinida]|uniref:DUF1826 domain-containing protein n=1 Tax=Candidatus Thiodiazotropha taylori TaxID=2792791 RepID=A0A9E4TSK8_9GAMM|nr:DUF1826 domain-containing protein [Candidatus Thiodiazotropha endolucinida]MCG7978399.1 DUF1826 domain-containing protein [Candidatus Thiodiazotropha taylori]MCW4236530.1 DUF1826 domain-containing protein [Candidatus Thiodiazotropha endolucinida]
MHQILTPQESATSTPGATSHIIGDSPDVLHQILDPGVNLSLWQRLPQTAITRELSILQASHLPDVRCPASLDSFDDDVSALLRQQGLDPLVFTNWRKDLRRLADLYFSLSDDRDVTLRLVTTDDDECRRFHVDRTNLRLLCTYRGPGTEWLTNDQVDRLAQATGAPNEDIIRFGIPSQFEPFWVGILKGDAFPDNASHGLVHRSPPIKGSGQTRVLFCLDC